jgi:hypothetical protein
MRKAVMSNWRDLTVTLRKSNSRFMRLQKISKMTELRKYEKEVEELIESLTYEVLARILRDSERSKEPYDGKFTSQ